MTKIVTFVLMAVFLLSSTACAWTDDVEGMLMPSPRGEDNMSDPEAILENIESSSSASSGDKTPAVEWE